MDKTKFTVNPQHDSEGFTDYTAPCCGCSTEDMCPRSGHCLRYDSPLRIPHGGSVHYQSAPSHDHLSNTVYLRRHNDLDPSVPSWMGNEKAAPLDMSEYSTFDGETGTYSDPQCAQCPWRDLDDDHLERIHKLWRESSDAQRAELHALLDQANSRGL